MAHPLNPPLPLALHGTLALALLLLGFVSMALLFLASRDSSSSSKAGGAAAGGARLLGNLVLASASSVGLGFGVQFLFMWGGVFP